MLLPYFNCGILSYYNAPAYAINRLRVCQKRAIRAICGLEYNAHTNNHFKEHNILKFDDLYKLNLCSTVFSQLECPSSNLISNRLVRSSDLHGYNTRFRGDFIVPYYAKTSSQSCFLYQAVSEWNKIPQAIKDSRSTHCFRGKLKKYFLNLY